MPRRDAQGRDTPLRSGRGEERRGGMEVEEKEEGEEEEGGNGSHPHSL